MQNGTQSQNATSTSCDALHAILKIMAATIPVSFALRDNVNIEQLLEILKSLDIEVTGVGITTVSGRTSLPQCEKVFNVRITIHQPELPGRYDMGVSGGFSTDKTPTIPKQLEPYVKTVSIVPPLRRL